MVVRYLKYGKTMKNSNNCKIDFTKKTVCLLTISVTLESSKLVGVVSASAVLKLSSSNTSEISSSSEKSLAKNMKKKKSNFVKLISRKKNREIDFTE